MLERTRARPGTTMLERTRRGGKAAWTGSRRCCTGAPPQRPGSSEKWSTYYEEYRRLGLPTTAPILQ